MDRVVSTKMMMTSLLLLFSLTTLPLPSTAISGCNGPCITLNDCSGQLICINGKCADDPQVGTHICCSTSGCNCGCWTLNDCPGQLICINNRCNDDPQVGTHICPSSPPTVPTPPVPTPSVPTPPPPGGSCQSSGTLTCGVNQYPRYQCSPPITSPTRAILTVNDFSPGGDGGAPSECDNMYHSNSELIVALSTGWYAGGSRCGRMIRITSTRTGRSVTAKVVDECDSMNGCDAEHAYQPPCRNNIVDGSSAVWNALGLNVNVGEEDITWSPV